MDTQKLAEDYIKRQERFYNRPLGNLNRFLIRDFAKVMDSQNIHDTQIPVPSSKPVMASQSGKIRVALITEDVGHLTGGRYYAYFIAMALTDLGFEVTIYTNREAAFGESFKNYTQPEIKVINVRAKELESLDIVADIYLGSPISGNIAASRLGAKYHKPSFALIFDPFPMMAKYLGEKTYTGWLPLIKQLRESDTKIISLCKTASGYIYDWLNKRPEQVFEIFPCINSKEMPKEPLAIMDGKGDYVVFISRLVRHKNFDHALRAVKNLGLKMKVISSVDGIQAQDLVRRMGMTKQVEFHMKCTDRQKFEIIANAKLVLNASTFEGFGMWAIEAVAMGVPLVCYDFPTIKEIRDYAGVDNFYLATWNDPKDLELQLKKALEEKRYKAPSHLFDFESMKERVGKVFVPEVKIGVVMIALNEEKFIKSAIKAVIKHPNIKKVAVVEGAVTLFAHAATEKGLSIDKTDKKINELIGEPNADKVIVDRYGWAKDKSELRNRALTLLGTDITHVLVVDGDEVWKMEDLDNLVAAIEKNPQKGVFLFPFYHFWKQKDLVATGGQWDNMMFRCFRFADKSLHWGLHQLPVVNQKGEFITATDGSIVCDNVHVYHYGYLKSEKDVLSKLEYYKKRDTQLKVDPKIYTDWKPGLQTQPTHGGGTAVKFEGEHPDEVKGII